MFGSSYITCTEAWQVVAISILKLSTAILRFENLLFIMKKEILRDSNEALRVRQRWHKKVRQS